MAEDKAFTAILDGHKYCSVLSSFYLKFRKQKHRKQLTFSSHKLNKRKFFKGPQVSKQSITSLLFFK